MECGHATLLPWILRPNAESEWHSVPGTGEGRNTVYKQEKMKANIECLFWARTYDYCFICIIY